LHSQKFRSRRMSLFDDLPLSWAPYGWPERSPIFCDNPLDMTRYRWFSGVRLVDQGRQRKKRKVASLRDIEDLSATQPSHFIFLCSLDPDGCLAADRLRIRTKTVWKFGRRQQKGFVSGLEVIPAKKFKLFCDGGVFFVDRCLLMGAMKARVGWYAVSFVLSSWIRCNQKEKKAAPNDLAFRHFDHLSALRPQTGWKAFTVRIHATDYLPLPILFHPSPCGSTYIIMILANSFIIVMCHSNVANNPNPKWFQLYRF